jgi:hypothetical protein
MLASGGLDEDIVVPDTRIEDGSGDVPAPDGPEDPGPDEAPDTAPDVEPDDAAPDDAPPDLEPDDAAPDDAPPDLEPDDAAPDDAPPDLEPDDAAPDDAPPDLEPDDAAPDDAVDEAATDEGGADEATIDDGAEEWSCTDHDVAYRVRSSADDAREMAAEGCALDSWGALLGRYSSAPTYVGFRFTAVEIPADAEIRSAVLRVRAYEAGSATGTSTTLAFEAVSDAASFACTTDPVTGSPRYRRLYPGGMSWSLGSWTAGTWYDSPDLAELLEVHLETSGWIAGNDLVLVATGPASGAAAAYRRAAMFDSDPWHAAELRVSYRMCGP